MKVLIRQMDPRWHEDAYLEDTSFLVASRFHANQVTGSDKDRFSDLSLDVSEVSLRTAKRSEAGKGGSGGNPIGTAGRGGVGGAPRGGQNLGKIVVFVHFR